MADISDFNTDNVEPMGSFDPLPAGWYPMVITDSEMRETRDREGLYLALTFIVLDGHPMAGRKIFSNVNVKNKSDKAVEIGLRMLKSLKEATGKLNARLSEELHDVPVSVKVKVRPGDAQYGPSNEVQTVEKYDPAKFTAATPAAAGHTPQPAQQAAPAAAGAAEPSARPWMRGGAR